MLLVQCGQVPLKQKEHRKNFWFLCKLFWSYFDAQVDKSTAKENDNVVHLPLINIQDDTTPVLHIVPSPELHLMLGPVNTLFDEMSKVWPGSEEWLNGCHVKKSEYRGGQFEGNDRRKLFRNVDMLHELCLHEYHQFVDAFISFNNVVTSCYGKIYYHSIKLVYVTLKMHI